MYNLFSLILGLSAWGLGIAAIRKKGCPWCIFGSFTCCGIALLCQHLDMDRLAQINDVSAILDTAHARVLAGAILLGITILLNLLALLRHRKDK